MSGAYIEGGVLRFLLWTYLALMISTISLFRRVSQLEKELNGWREWEERTVWEETGKEGEYHVVVKQRD